MNVTASKVLLAVSLASYAFCVKDHLLPTVDAKPTGNGKAKELTADMVNRNFALKIVKDVCGSTKLDGTFESPVSLGATTDVPREIGNVKLQGIILGPNGRTAMLNGVPFHQGESAPLGENGPVVLARRVAADYVIVESAGKVVLLRLDEPTLKEPESGGHAAATGTTGTTGTSATTARPASPARRTTPAAAAPQTGGAGSHQGPDRQANRR